MARKKKDVEPVEKEVAAEEAFPEQKVINELTEPLKKLEKGILQQGTEMFDEDGTFLKESKTIVREVGIKSLAVGGRDNYPDEEIYQYATEELSSSKRVHRH